MQAQMAAGKADTRPSWGLPFDFDPKSCLIHLAHRSSSDTIQNASTPAAPLSRSFYTRQTIFDAAVSRSSYQRTTYMFPGLFPASAPTNEHG